MRLVFQILDDDGDTMATGNEEFVMGFEEPVLRNIETRSSSSLVQTFQVTVRGHDSRPVHLTRRPIRDNPQA